MKTIYIASKAKHAPKWLALRAQGYNIISTWIDEYLPGATTDTINLAVRCVKESSTADYLLLYCEEGEILKDANVEYGCALGNGKKIFIVGSCAALGNTLKFHPNVEIFNSVEIALYKIHGRI